MCFLVCLTFQLKSCLSLPHLICSFLNSLQALQLTSASRNFSGIRFQLSVDYQLFRLKLSVDCSVHQISKVCYDIFLWYFNFQASIDFTSNGGMWTAVEFIAFPLSSRSFHFHFFPFQNFILPFISSASHLITAMFWGRAQFFTFHILCSHAHSNRTAARRGRLPVQLQYYFAMKRWTLFVLKFAYVELCGFWAAA